MHRLPNIRSLGTPCRLYLPTQGVSSGRAVPGGPGKGSGCLHDVHDLCRVFLERVRRPYTRDGIVLVRPCKLRAQLPTFVSTPGGLKTRRDQQVLTYTEIYTGGLRAEDGGHIYIRPRRVPPCWFLV